MDHRWRNESVLSDQEVKEICDSCGSDYLPRKETINLSEFGFAA